MAIISIRELGKRFTIGGRREDTLRDHLAALFRRRQRTKDDSFWALNGVSFDVAAGEVVGIIGRNGAGKSTLLKILAQISEPTTGEVRIRGRVASLLEVGTGFHSELTGRENIFLSGAILGMSRAEIRRKFEEIVVFSEVEAFLDTPVKHYSSGMQMKLAFAVAAHLDPEILLVDEVLAVGDGAFQKKCLGKMGEVTGQGRTVLFVSHSMAAMQSLCRRVVWLEKGRVRRDGDAGEVIADYLHVNSTPLSERRWDDAATAPGNDVARLRGAAIYPAGGAPGDPIGLKSEIEMRFDYDCLKEGTHLHLSVHILNEYNQIVFVTNTVRDQTWHGKPFRAGRYRSTWRIPPHLLNDGSYRVRIYLLRDKNQLLCEVGDLLIFDVHDDAPEMRVGWYGRWQGVVRPWLDCETTFCGD